MRKFSWKTKVRFLTFAFLAILITGCGGNSVTPEETAQEKRNNFDACVIQWFIENTSNTQGSTDYYRSYAEAACLQFLK
jgi:hypothetical protein